MQEEIFLILKIAVKCPLSYFDKTNNIVDGSVPDTILGIKRYGFIDDLLLFSFSLGVKSLSFNNGERCMSVFLFSVLKEI